MAAEMIELELYVVYDGSGDYRVHHDSETDARELYADDVGGSELRRCVKIKLKAPAPLAIELTGVVPAESETGAALTCK